MLLLYEIQWESTAGQSADRCPEQTPTGSNYNINHTHIYRIDCNMFDVAASELLQRTTCIICWW